jgi:hypothetical protein
MTILTIEILRLRHRILWCCNLGVSENKLGLNCKVSNVVLGMEISWTDRVKNVEVLSWAQREVQYTATKEG